MRVATIGAGWAGAAAAVTLSRLGHDVTVFEVAPVAGGRARRVARQGLPLDNGQHLLLGAYEQARNLLAVVHGDDGESGRLVRTPLVVAPPRAAAGVFALRALPWPAPLGLLAGLVGARGLALADRFGAAAWFARLRAAGFCPPAGATVAELCATGPRAAAEALWYPLCIAALNTPPERACAQVFANVLRAALAGRAGASDYLLPATDLSALFPEPALRYVERHGGRVLMRTAARVAGAGSEGIALDVRGERERFDAAVVAVGPHQLAAVLPRDAIFGPFVEAAGRLSHEPIATAWLGYAAATRLAAPILRLDDAPGQWLLDRPDVLARAEDDATRPALAQLVSVVISASGAHDALPPPELALACDTQLRRLLPGLPALAWSQTIVERRATYACTPNRARAPSSLPHARIALAGDWLDTEFPATLEAAVRSGVAAAFALASAREGAASP